MDATERELVVNSLHAQRERLLNAIAGLTPEQRGFRSEPERWSVAECVEHIILVENRVMDSIEQQLQCAPEPEKAAGAVGKARLIMRAVPARGTRVKTPEGAAPSGRWPDFVGLVEAFEKTRQRSIRFAVDTEAELRSHFFPHFVFKDMDCYQWLVFLGAHCERHVLQIEEIRADAGLPIGTL